MGLMKNWPDPGYLPYYNCSVTEAGKKAMRNESPNLQVDRIPETLPGMVGHIRYDKFWFLA